MPGKDGGWSRKFFSDGEARELAEPGSGPIKPSLRIGRSAAPQPMGYAGQRLASKGSRQLGAVEAARPAAERGGIGHPIGVLQRGRRLFPGAVLHKVSPERLTAGQQAVAGVGERERGKEGEGLSASMAKAAPDPNPVVMFIVRLLAPATVTDDRIAFTNRTSSQDELVAVCGPIGFQLVRRGGKWDKKNRAS